MRGILLVMSALSLSLAWREEGLQHRIFNCGNLMYYRTFRIVAKESALYVGASDRVFKLSLDKIDAEQSCDKVSIKLEPPHWWECMDLGRTFNECRNHIKVILKISPDLLYVCGTNGYKPMDWLFHMNLTVYENKLPGIGDGLGNCPFNPDDNSTAIWVKDENSDRVPGLYTGTDLNALRTDKAIHREHLIAEGPEAALYPALRTVQQDHQWLYKPDFVGSFSRGKYVYFFFREKSIEDTCSHTVVYSRVARVCKDDLGGTKRFSNQIWTTYLKARLNCSIPGAQPYYINEIQDVFEDVPARTFYAVFTTPAIGFYGSAVCAFTRKAIDEVFDGPYKEKRDGVWGPVKPSNVPKPRPGSCVENTRKLSDQVLLFHRDHPLMDLAVSAVGNQPLYTSSNVLFTTITKVERRNMRGDSYNVIFAGTTDGIVYKIAQNITDGASDSTAKLADTWTVTDDEPVRVLARSLHSLYIGSDSRVTQVFFRDNCASRHFIKEYCNLDPYCDWTEGSSGRGSCQDLMAVPDLINNDDDWEDFDNNDNDVETN